MAENNGSIISFIIFKNCTINCKNNIFGLISASAVHCFWYQFGNSMYRVSPFHQMVPNATYNNREKFPHLHFSLSNIN